MTTNNADVTTHRIKWCDLKCEYAGFAKLEAMDGSCREEKTDYRVVI